VIPCLIRCLMIQLCLHYKLVLIFSQNWWVCPEISEHKHNSGSALALRRDVQCFLASTSYSALSRGIREQSLQASAATMFCGRGPFGTWPPWTIELLARSEGVRSSIYPWCSLRRNTCMVIARSSTKLEAPAAIAATLLAACRLLWRRLHIDEPHVA
jgi:hypothetical protein